jgi:hypothetical protein
MMRSTAPSIQVPHRAPTFLSEDKERYTLLCPQMVPIADSLFMISSLSNRPIFTYSEKICGIFFIIPSKVSVFKSSVINSLL